MTGQSLAERFPELAAQWHPTKNGDLTPNDVAPFSHRKCWWICNKGHEWLAVVGNRSNGNSCPYCAGRMVLPGNNDFATCNPALAQEWHPTLNDGLKPSMVLPHSNKNVWWLCPICGGEWKTTVNNRSNGHCCPFCSGARVLSGKNDLATLFPDIASEWHPVKNPGISPDFVLPGSNQLVWWLCKEGHEWKTSVLHRTLHRTGCPYCKANRLQIGINDAATIHPELVEQVHPTKNPDKTLEGQSCTSKEYFIWRCKHGHEWKATVVQRTRGYGCPYCSGMRIITGKTDLATLYPEIAAEWHPTKNGDLQPDQVAQYNDRVVWWLCTQGHEWASPIFLRTRFNQGCPVCMKMDQRTIPIAKKRSSK